MLHILTSYTDGPAMLSALAEEAAKQPGIASRDQAASFMLGYMAEYIATLNQDATDLDDEPRPLTDAEVDELLVNVSISKLERLLHERRLELADTPDELKETIEDIGRLNGGDL